ncbi:hypothetical protein JCGZ_25825 [Jatropha curcas]|uniref:Cell wall protein n=1 Tax=Jatropha curcas TaxID=180498 RepID=A0A067JMY1_JATCU|nr:putative cell wall protein [Jatropha curcas]KDP24168.1 hypothetical protein JCGZ_25825 [Jatropha curcas]
MVCGSNLSLIALFILLAISGQALGGRHTPKKSKDVDVKQPEWLTSDRSFLIPGIGREMLPPSIQIPPYLNVPAYDPYVGIGAGTGNDLPGGDDTTIPNPGVEVPSPSSGSGNVPAHP